MYVKTMKKQYKYSIDEKAWRAKLTPLEYRVLREGGTEAPFSGEYVNFNSDGSYSCKGCGESLFRGEDKFDSHCGWPSFFKASEEANIEYIEDLSHGMVRTELRCGNCGSHLGHIFNDGPQPTGLRYCINSASISHSPERLSK